MKISEVIQKTGLSKRSIHHYIEEGLVKPGANPSNSYKIFTEQDIMQLSIIKKLRELDFSLASIQSILTHPNTMKYHLYLQLKKEEQEVQLHQKRMEAITFCIEKTSLGITREEFSDMLSTLPPITTEDDSANFISPKDAQLILTFMWGMFIMDIPMTEYRQYLWDKLAGKLELPESRYLLPVKKYFYSRPIDHVEAQFAKRNLLIDRIASFDRDACISYVEEMKRKIEGNLNDDTLILKWKELYHPFIKPTATCADSTAHELLSEFCPRFADYCININDCCEQLLRYLNSEEGYDLRKKIQRTLPGYIDLNASHSGELAALASFRETI